MPMYVLFLSQTESRTYIALPKKLLKATLFNERFMAARDRERRYEKTAFVYFLVCKTLASHDVGVARDTIVREIRPIARFQTSDFFYKRNWGGYRSRTTTKGRERLFSFDLMVP